ncbi:MAG TPA: hypothetical protein VFW33_07835 [Gemmataceae bacterium]|nr:hypothetical protein [Gemmataceae bacterium]
MNRVPQVSPSPYRGNGTTAEADALRSAWQADIVTGAKALNDAATKRLQDSEAQLTARFGAYVEAELTRRLAAVEQRLDARHVAQLDALGEAVADLRRQLAEQADAAREALQAVRDEAARERTQALAHLQRLVSDLYSNAPVPLVNVEVPAPSVSVEVPAPVVNLPEGSITLTLPPRRVVKEIAYAEDGRPVQITETEGACPS